MGAAALKFVEHGGAGVDCGGATLRIADKKLLKEAAIAIAEDEGVVGIVEVVEETGAGALQEWAQRDVLDPAVDGGDAIKVWFGAAHRVMSVIGISGVRRTRSASARRWMG
jgi:hypothetical protein